MNLSLLNKAANLSEIDPAASNLMFDLDKAETAREVQDALDNYDIMAKARMIPAVSGD